MAIPASTEIPLSGNAFIDGLLSGGKWLSGRGKLTLTWGTADNPNQGYFWTDPAATAADIRVVMQQWSNVANINFSYSGHFPDFATANADIAISITDGTILPGAALGVFPLSSWVDDVLASTDFNRTSWPQPEGDIFANIEAAGGSSEHTAYLAHHELGHALGLKHPHDGGPVGNPTFAQLGIADFDSTLSTVMSYDYFALPFPATPMPLDILAIQYLYGPNLSHRTGNNVYKLGETGNMKTIWDAGGRDVFDASGSPAGATIDLNDFNGFGSGYSFHGLASITAIAAGVVIEGAIGSSFDDVILGNEVNNSIAGLGGDDIILGARGDDVLNGAGGADKLLGGPGNDRLLGGGGDDVLKGSGGDDLMRGHGGADRLLGGGGNDTLIGAGGNDVANGGGGNDFLRGGNRDDKLLGGAGNDELIGDRGDDLLKGGGGDDVLVGGPGDDRLFGNPGADLFVFAPGHGTALILDFEDDIDALDLTAFGFATVREAKSFASNVNGDVVFDFAGGEQLIVADLIKAQLTGDDILV